MIGDVPTQTETEQPAGLAKGETRAWYRKPAFWSLLILVAILVVGAYFRFTGLNWDETYHLHPDERFLTDVASLLKSTDPISYLRTSESTLNPYNFGRTFYVYGNFPMTITRLIAEAVDNFCLNLADPCNQRFVYFDGIQFVGRALSGLVDLVTIVFIFLIGRRLYDWRVGLLGALLMALAVLPIQQSHFFTMDNWAATFTTITLYTAVRVSEDGKAIVWWILFGIFLGFTVASRINVAPLALLAILAGFIWLVRRIKESDRDWRYLQTSTGVSDLQYVIFGVLLAAAVSAVTFRLAQPYAFSDPEIVRQTVLAETGEEPGVLRTLVSSIVGLNPQWRANMTEIQNLQSPDASFPPALQWTDRTPILFPLSNMILWGMGLTAGLAAVAGFLWAFSKVIFARPGWLNHLLLVSWAGIYFLFMATRWVKSIRYFLPIYPALFILAGWALIELWRRSENSRLKKFGAALVIALVIIPTALWANAFIDIYRQPVTRVQASEWIFENVPSGATLLFEVDGELGELQLPVGRFLLQPGGPPLLAPVTLSKPVQALGIRFNYLSDPDAALGADRESLAVTLSSSPGSGPIAESMVMLNLGNQRESVTAKFPELVELEAGDYFLSVEPGQGGSINVGTSVLLNEHWDDSLPVRLEGRDPYSMYYSGLSEGLAPVTYPDNESKRESIYRWLEEADYIVLSSQRALWSVPRLPLSFPLMAAYYESLFNGELGFDLVGQFHAEIDIGPLYISDVGGRMNWGGPPNIGWPPPGELAAEEAFSVYDHPPVWLFAKSNRYSLDNTQEILSKVDLSKVVPMTPGTATQAPNGLLLTTADRVRHQANGTFSHLFEPDGLLSRAPWLAAVVWWIAVVLLGLINFPISFVTFAGLPDRGYAISRIMALLFVSYFGWLMASLGLLPHTRQTLFIGLLLIMTVNAAILVARRGDISTFFRRNIRYVAFIEIFGLILFTIFIVIRLGNPDVWDVIWGGEKPMDLSYFNAVMKSTTFPPYDPWFSGGYINYYYYGFVFVGALTKLLAIAPSVAYNLALPMLASFTGLGAFCIGYNLYSSYDSWQTKNQIKDRIFHPLRHHFRRALAAGIVSAVLIVILGNLAEVPLLLNTFYRASDSTVNTGITSLDTVMRTGDGALDLILTEKSAPIYPGDWFWTATRAINAEPGEVQPITEFPFFTFLYGDLHAHMIALPLTLLALAWSISFVLFARRRTRKPDYVSKGRMLAMILAGALSIAVLRATNTWDFPTYLFLGSLAVGYGTYLVNGKLDVALLGRLFVNISLLLGFAILLFLPYTNNYGGAYESVSLWPGSYTQLPNYIVIYGLFLLLIGTHIAIEFRSWSATWTLQSMSKTSVLALPIILGLFAFVGLLLAFLIKGYWIAPVVLPLIMTAGLLGLRPSLPVERRIVLILISAALGLTMMVELIVLDGDIGRMNTVFKFYMQVWVMLSSISGAILVWAWPNISRRRWGVAWKVSLAILVAAAALYPLLATKAKWDIRMSDEAPMTLDGMAFMETTQYTDTALDGSGQQIALKHDYDAIKWLQRNVEGSPVIAEAHSYNPYRSAANRVTMYTGLPTIVGWDWHQRQQRAILPPTLISNRIFDVNNLYSTEDIEVALEILEKYDVSYVYVGPLEWIYYPPPGLIKFERMAQDNLLKEVYRNSGVSIYEVIG